MDGKESRNRQCNKENWTPQYPKIQLHTKSKYMDIPQTRIQFNNYKQANRDYTLT